jgi:hypothetical protein
MDDWSKLEKPWSREECRNRYVQGRRIGLRKLAIESGVAAQNLSTWSMVDGWVEQRQQFQDKARSESDRGAIAIAASENSKILQAHYANYVEASSVAVTLLGVAKNVAEGLSGTLDPYKLQAAASGLNQTLNALKTAIDGQRQALGLQYNDINVATEFLTGKGFRIVDSTQDEEEIPVFDNGRAIEITVEELPPAP